MQSPRLDQVDEPPSLGYPINDNNDESFIVGEKTSFSSRASWATALQKHINGVLGSPT